MTSRPLPIISPEKPILEPAKSCSSLRPEINVPLPCIRYINRSWTNSFRASRTTVREMPYIRHSSCSEYSRESGNSSPLRIWPWRMDFNCSHKGISISRLMIVSVFDSRMVVSDITTFNWLGLLNLDPGTSYMKLHIVGTVNRLNVEHRTSNIERPIWNRFAQSFLK